MRKNKQLYQNTISEEEFQTWKKLTRKKDIDAIAALCNVSWPTAQKMLTYGYVTKMERVAVINKFFLDRLEAEKDRINAFEGVEIPEPISKKKLKEMVSDSIKGLRAIQNHIAKI